MNESARANSLGSFLRQRRAELTPEDVGLAAHGNTRRRRARGLRREEVAALAALSTDYYTRIEQGRRTAPAATLEAIARVLRIDADGVQYMQELSSIGRPTSKRRRPMQAVSPGLRGLLADLATTPALVLGQRMDILAWNPLATRLLLTDFDQLPTEQRNYVRLLFTHPEMRQLYKDWETTGRTCVFQLHMDVAREPGDRQLAQLVGELSVSDRDFRKWWGEHQVAAGNGGTKTFRHPVVGDMDLNWETLILADDPDQRLVTWNAAVGSQSHQRLITLATSE